VTADVGNRHQDIVVLGSPTGSSTSVSVLRGNGDGTFKPAITTNLPVQANSLAVGDFSGDGKLDVVIEEVPLGDAIVTSQQVLFGNGYGTLTPGPTQVLGNRLVSLAVADFSRDGKQEIAVLNPLGPIGGNLLEVFSGNGDGTVATPPDVFQTGGTPFGVAAGDFNGDGRSDLALANSIGDYVGVLRNTSGTAVTAVFSAAQGVLPITGDANDNTIVVSRDAAGTTGVNHGAVTIQGGPATVANTRMIVMRGGPGNDIRSLNEANGPLPRAFIAGDDGNDTLSAGKTIENFIGGALADTITGNALNNSLSGGAGNDTLDGGARTDTLDGGAGTDVALNGEVLINIP
jgi:Ca2+-binding RTX toxin-like protein